MGIARRQIRWNGWGWAAHQDGLEAHENFWHWLAGALDMPALLATPARPLEDITLPAPRLTPAQIAGFVAILGPDRVAQDDYERAFHARGRSYHDLIRLRAGDLSSAPDAVLYPRSETEVLALLELAAREKIAVIPFGGGTGRTGGVTARPGSVTVDLSGMDQVLAVDSQAGTAVVEAGITGSALEKALAAKGLALGAIPENFEFSTLGGWIATSGGHSDWLLDASLATPNGLLDTNTITAGGPDLTRLLPGSEGVFGIITKARVKLRPAATPLFRAFLFREFSGGSAAIRAAMRGDIACSMLHLSDAEETRVLRVLAELEQPPGLVERLKHAWARPSQAGACLMTGSFPDRLSLRRFTALARQQGGTALDEAPAKRWLAMRAQAPYRQGSMLDRGVGVDTLESAADWASLPALYTGAHAALETAMRDNNPRPGAHGIVLGHLSDADACGANLAFTILFPRQLEQEVVQWQTIKRVASDAFLAHGGRVSHHGVGEDNLAWMEREKGALGLSVLRGLKSALDPDGVLNPGKLIPPV